ncbi:MAG: response regulator transcription factor [Chitinophagaceae bacterium]|uniref:response regulator n=1 Tax=unclassified Paraflavitalea TaxID=2798305 RepID=UPI003D351E60|nr:response regulator transcription factor [Chitinophagaceae bacterium]
MIQVVLIEDHQLIVEGIRSMFHDHPGISISQHAHTKEGLERILKSNKPHIILLDINLPDTNGFELCSWLKQKHPEIGIIALSVNNEPAIIRKMIDKGADGYLLKDASQQEIETAIKKVDSGKEYFSGTVAQLLKQKENSGIPKLTRREREILEQIANGLTNQQIADLLFIDITTVSSHRKNMLAKYELQNTAALIKFAILNKLI